MTIAVSYTKAEYQGLIDVKKKEILHQYKKQVSNWDEETLMKLAESATRSHIAERVQLMSFEEFSKQST